MTKTLNISGGRETALTNRNGDENPDNKRKVVVSENPKKRKEDIVMELKDLLGSAYKEGMTLDEVTTALKDITMPTDNSAEVERLKNALSQSNSEAAGYKKQLREKMSEEEAAKAKAQEETEKIQKELDALRRESAVSKNKAKLVGLGYDEALADETAEAMADGNLEKVFANQKKHLDAFEKKVRADVLKNTPKPSGGDGGSEMTLDKLRKMSPQERYEFSVKNPEQYKALYTGNPGEGN